MPNDNDLPGTTVPLDPAIQEAITAFNEPVNHYQLVRLAASTVLLQDLIEDVRKILKNQGGSL